MPDPTPSPELSFDRATFTSPSTSAAAPCGGCKRPLEGQYWKWQRLIVCRTCKDGLAGTLAKSQSGSSFGKAFLQGGAAALGCGIAYAVFASAMHGQYALVTIGIAYVIATVIRKASHGVSGRKFQVLAVALTYGAATMGYAPGIFDALKGAGEQEHHAAAPAGPGLHPASAPAVAPAAAPDSDETTDATDSAPAAPKKAAGPFELVIGIVFLVGLTLVAPFLEITEAPLGVLIIGIGMWEAWRRSRGLPMVIEGPFQVAAPQVAQPTPAPAPQEAAPPAA